MMDTRVKPAYDAIAYVVFVIASQRVGAERRPMTGSAKQSRRLRSKTWIASSLRSSQ
jgi:hypothetical protein